MQLCDILPWARYSTFHGGLNPKKQKTLVELAFVIEMLSYNYAKPLIVTFYKIVSEPGAQNWAIGTKRVY